MARDPSAPGVATPGRMIARGLVRHCPRCGGAGVFRSWFSLRERCPTCGMRFEREEGFWLGGYVINFGTGEVGLIVLFALLIGAEANGTHINVWPYVIGGLVLAVVGPAVTFPFSRTVWSAIDLVMRPLSEDEIVSARADVARRELEEDPLRPSGRGPSPPEPGSP